MSARPHPGDRRLFVLFFLRLVLGDDLLLESRILAVADVVEAIMTHRPYRQALGPDVALAAIEDGKGALFDPEVVNACMCAFRERNFAFD